MAWPKRVGSVRIRITILATTVVAVALIIGSLALLGLLRAALLRSQSGEAEQRASAITAMARDAALPNPLPSMDAPRLTLVQVIGVGQTVLAASSQLQGVPPLVVPGQSHRHVVHSIIGADGTALDNGPWLAESAPADVAGQPVTVVVVTSLAEYARSADLLHTSLLITVPILVALVAIIVWLVVGRALRPVESMRAEVESITGHQLDRRVPTLASNDEIAKLANTLNDMLDRLQANSDAQRRFVADASHELRTPIANIRLAVEVATAHPEHADWLAVADDVLRQDERMQLLTDDLLLLAKAEARAQAGAGVRRFQAVDVAKLVRAEVGRAVPSNRRLVATGATEPTSSIVLGDSDQLARMLTNLVDNALRHAEQTVTVGMRIDGTSVEIAVTDDGPGIAPGDREVIFDPFVRLDQHRARGQGGTGLGLSIVRRVAQAHHATVSVVGAEPGTGATFVVRIPLIGAAVAPAAAVSVAEGA